MFLFPDSIARREFPIPDFRSTSLTLTPAAINIAWKLVARNGKRKYTGRGPLSTGKKRVVVPESFEFARVQVSTRWKALQNQKFERMR